MTNAIVKQIVIIMFAWLYGTNLLGAQSNTLKQDFLSKYEPAAKRLERLYLNVQIIATGERLPPPDKSDEPIMRWKLDFRAKGQLMRLDAFPITSNERGEVNAVVVVANPTRSFSAHRSDDQSLYTLDSLDNRYQDRTARICLLHQFPMAPYGWPTGTLFDFLSQPQIEIKQIEERSQNDEIVIRVSFVSHKVIAGAKATGWIDFSPKLAWAILGYSYGAEDQAIPNREETCARIEYDGERDGIPILSKAEYWAEIGPEHKMGYRRIYSVDQLSFEPIHDSDFTPAAIGINIPEIGEKPGFSRFVSLCVFGLLLVLIAVFIARLRSKYAGKQSKR